ncbi:MAG TPA: ABC transporter substrate-binding protein [Candidatus Limnocylindrales bacterium]|nr:ABC transporter substrate-binding protein [Candidatus Limnocylindrales bacterium]
MTTPLVHPRRRPSRLGLGIALLAIAAPVGGFVLVKAVSAQPIRIGAVFPITGNARALAVPELTGVRIAVDMVNADGGIDGRPVVLDVRDLESRADADGIMAGFARDGIRLVIGAYSSDLSIAASAAADKAGLLYWESGAVADQLTGRGLPLVFRVGASGTNLGSNSATFVATQLASRLGKAVGQTRVAIVNANDAYATSVADAAASTATTAGLDVVAQATYDLGMPDWTGLMDQLKAARPDAIILASHIPDGVAFRQAMLASGLRVGALIGSTMAECDPDFAGDLGADAIGIFASDRPTAGFRPDALDPTAKAAYDRFSAAWAAATAASAAPTAASAASGAPAWGSGDPAWGSGEPYTLIGPAESPTAEASEEALAGFSAAWALFTDVLPAAASTSPGLDPAAVASVARAVDLPTGALPNGAGLRFSTDEATLGQNLRAAAVIWQWQAVRQYAFVWPPSYATGAIAFVPLGR